MNTARIGPIIKAIGAASIGLGLVLGSLSCSSKESGTSTSGGSSSGEAVKLSGAGATFPAPLYQQWFEDYRKANSNITIDYQSVGSGAGIAQFTAGTTDFGASDAAMSDEQIAKVTGGVQLLPMTAGEVVITYNLEGTPELKFSRKALADIYLGKVTKWNDPEITKDNPDVKLPDSLITTVHRSDGSGTTFCFTNHMTATSPDWANSPGPGKGTSVSWPVGIGGKGNEGVTADVKQTPGSIGYVEYGYAMTNNLPMAILENKAGQFVKATPEAGISALSTVVFPDNLRAYQPDPEGPTDYPIVTFTWMLLHPQYSDAAKGNALKAMIHYGLTDGQKISGKLGYIPLPDAVVAKVQAAADSIKVGS